MAERYVPGDIVCSRGPFWLPSVTSGSFPSALPATGPAMVVHVRRGTIVTTRAESRGTVVVAYGERIVTVVAAGLLIDVHVNDVCLFANEL